MTVTICKQSDVKVIDISFMNSGEDGRSRAEQLLYLLGQIDQYVSSPVDYQRRRGCLAAYEMLLKFRTLCVTGYCPVGCSGSCTHIKQVNRSLQRNSNLPCMVYFLYKFYPTFAIYHFLFYIMLFLSFQPHLHCQVGMPWVWEIG